MKSKQEVVSDFGRIFNCSPAAVAYAPGRLEILGNHTDYNQGVVLSAAIDRGTFFAVAPRAELSAGLCRVHDLRSGDEAEFSLNRLAQPQAGDWANYIKGIVVKLQERQLEIPAFQAVIYSTIPLSAGMSSSAALEMSTVLGLTGMLGHRLPLLELARIGQSCENDYVGARTGLMDQITSLYGRANHLVFSDFRSLQVETTAMPPGVSMVVANSMVKHVLTGAYNERRSRCEEAVAELSECLPGVTALRDVSRQQLEQYRHKLDITAYRRALHVIGENERVFAGVEALQQGRLEKFGQLLFESHDSSRFNFENSCPELDTLIELGKSLPGVIGGRLSGGGFGGITVHLVKHEHAGEFARRLDAAWNARAGKPLQPMICTAADGARIL